MTTSDPKTAVSALAAAKDIPALEAAIQAAAFLDTAPGDDRQKLRGEWVTHTRTNSRGTRHAGTHCARAHSPARPQLQRPARGSAR